MPAEQTEQLAADWLARQDRGLTAAEQAELAAWLEADTLNRVAWLRLKAAWQRADRLAALRRVDLRENPGQAVVRPGWRRAAAAAAILAITVTGAAVYFLRPAPSQSYATMIGQTQSVRLADGSRMELNTDTRLKTDVTASRRVVTLESGEAYFDVVHDEKRPFTVYAGSRRITDLGTKFSVYREGDDVRVTVREGRVRVDVIGAPVATPVAVDGGHAVVAQGNGTLVVPRTSRDIGDDLSWRSGMLVFNQQTLAEAADQFNRYNGRKIVVQGSARKIRIGGSFKAGNVDGFTLLLHEGFGLSVDNRGNTIVVSARE